MRIVIIESDEAASGVEDDIFHSAGLSATRVHARLAEDIVRLAQGADILLTGDVAVTEDAMAGLPDLRLIIQSGGGSVDLDAATRAGIVVCDMGDSGGDELADHAVALALTLLRKIPATVAATRSGLWDPALARPIRRFGELTVGLVGTGPAGRDFAAKMTALGFRTLIHDPDDITGAVIDDVIDLSDLIAVFYAPPDGTGRLLDAAMFDQMKSGVFLLSAAQGIVDEEALADALRSGKVAGAALDRTEVEPLPADSPLREFDTCLITPHMGWYSEDALRDRHRKAAEEVVRFAKGDPVLWPVNTPETAR